MASTDIGFPQTRFSWYIDEQKLAIVDNTTGEFDTFSGTTSADAIKIHFHKKYPKVDNIEDDLYSNIGLDGGLHLSLIDYVKSRLFEDKGKLRDASYYRIRFDMKRKTYPHRRTGRRALNIPRL
ncbi:hypothetical protein HN682_00675 [Candidatus Peregrinibacteria bacterium]|jgi:hypothetical protein|nr:hypothetical protein [Candidatus Peregrinibacteria bacterium]